MIYIVIGLVLVLVVSVYILYRIGKDVKKKEQQFQDMFDDMKVKDRLNKYKRKSTPKVPTIKK